MATYLVKFSFDDYANDDEFCVDVQQHSIATVQINAAVTAVTQQTTLIYGDCGDTN